MTPGAVLYRGVHAGHLAMADAVRGICRPGNALGNVTPQRHNDGGVSGSSPYTSWTFSRAIAAIFENRMGPGGVIRVAASEASPDPALWYWESQLAADDEWWKHEVLLWGVRSGLEVQEP